MERGWRTTSTETGHTALIHYRRPGWRAVGDHPYIDEHGNTWAHHGTAVQHHTANGWETLDVYMWSDDAIDRIEADAELAPDPFANHFA